MSCSDSHSLSLRYGIRQRARISETWLLRLSPGTAVPLRRAECASPTSRSPRPGPQTGKDARSSEYSNLGNKGSRCLFLDLIRAQVPPAKGRSETLNPAWSSTDWMTQHYSHQKSRDIRVIAPAAKFSPCDGLRGVHPPAVGVQLASLKSVSPLSVALANAGARA